MIFQTKEATIKVAELGGEKVDNKTKLELIKEEEARIKKEKEEEETEKLEKVRSWRSHMYQLRIELNNHLSGARNFWSNISA